MAGEGRWICVRQRAGPLVKEQRAVRPRLSQYDSPYERAEKNKILRPPRDSGVCRTRMDRLELLLALFGFDGWSYTLTFDEVHLPPSFADVRLCWRRLLYQMKKWHDGVTPDYVYLIEGRHGDHRYLYRPVLRSTTAKRPSGCTQTTGAATLGARSSVSLAYRSTKGTYVTLSPVCIGPPLRTAHRRRL
jgi:hypothetical protein